MKISHVQNEIVLDTTPALSRQWIQRQACVEVRMILSLLVPQVARTLSR